MALRSIAAGLRRFQQSTGARRGMRYGVEGPFKGLCVAWKQYV